MLCTLSLDQIRKKWYIARMFTYISESGKGMVTVNVHGIKPADAHLFAMIS